MALLLHMGGVPARVAAGFSTGVDWDQERPVHRARRRRPLVGVRGLLPALRLDHLRPDAGRDARAGADDLRPGHHYRRVARATTARHGGSTVADPSKEAGASLPSRRRTRRRSPCSLCLARSWLAVILLVLLAFARRGGPCCAGAAASPPTRGWPRAGALRPALEPPAPRYRHDPASQLEARASPPTARARPPTCAPCARARYGYGTGTARPPRSGARCEPRAGRHGWE